MPVCVQVPLSVSRDVGTLTHAVSLALWGVHDREEVLKAACEAGRVRAPRAFRFRVLSCARR